MSRGTTPANPAGWSSSAALVMNRAGPAGFPRSRGIQPGSGARGAGIHLALSSVNSSRAGTRLFLGLSSNERWRSTWKKRSNVVLALSTLLAGTIWGLRFAGFL